MPVANKACAGWNMDDPGRFVLAQASSGSGLSANLQRFAEWGVENAWNVRSKRKPGGPALPSLNALLTNNPWPHAESSSGIGKSL
jgi:hypothetical protein